MVKRDRLGPHGWSAHEEPQAFERGIVLALDVGEQKRRPSFFEDAGGTVVVRSRLAMTTSASSRATSTEPEFDETL